MEQITHPTESLTYEQKMLVSEMLERAKDIEEYLKGFPDNDKVRILNSLISSFNENLKHHYMYLNENKYPHKEQLYSVTCWDSDEIEDVYEKYESGEYNFEKAKEEILKLEKRYEKELKKEHGKENTNI